METFILYVIAVAGVVAPFSSAQCVDGAYKHDGRDCCLCPAGQYLVEHCTENLQNGKCEFCQPGTYSSEPTNLMSCEGCMSCSHENANLEEEEPCTPARNSKCRCRQGHYCSSKTEICRLCNPCTTCDGEGIKVPCTANNDTVCNDKTTGGGTAKIIVPIVSIVLVAVLSILGVFLYKRQKKRKQTITTTGTNRNAEVIQPLTEVVLHPYLPEIADIIGWKDMKDIAISTNMPLVRIEAVKNDHKDDSREQTLQLLIDFNEMHSSKASSLLIETLKRKGKNATADLVHRLLAGPPTDVPSV